MNKNIHMGFDNYEHSTCNLFEIGNHLTLICVLQPTRSGYKAKIVHLRLAYLIFKVKYIKDFLRIFVTRIKMPLNLGPTYQRREA